MKKLALLLLVSAPLAACERVSHSAPPAPAAANAAAAAPAAHAAAPASTANAATVGDDPSVPRIPTGTKAACAVTGEEFRVNDKTVQVTYNGKRYAFCCADCAPTFAKNPAKFAK